MSLEWVKTGVNINNLLFHYKTCFYDCFMDQILLIFLKCVLISFHVLGFLFVLLK